MSEPMTAEAIRAHVDDMGVPRVHDDGTINAQFVALEQTLRERHGVPKYVASLDGPGKFRPLPPTIWLEAHATTHDVVQRGATGHDGRQVSHHLAVVLADAEHTVVLEGSRTRLMDMLERTLRALAEQPAQPTADERQRVIAPGAHPLPTQAEAKRSPYIGTEHVTVVVDDPAGGTL